MATRRKLSGVIKVCIRDTARKAGVRLSVRNIDNKHVWNGKTIALFEADGSRRPDANIVHDIAHYVVASVTRRKYPEFGLGDSPDNGPPSARQFLTYENAQYEEEEASLLGILIEKELKLDPEDTFVHHSWDVCDDTLWALLTHFHAGDRDSIGCQALQRLCKKGHLDAKMRPKVLIV